MEEDTANNSFERNTLNNVNINTRVQIKNLNCTGSLRRRLLDLGPINGTFITPILISPSR